MDEITKRLGAEMKAARKRANLTQEMLATQLGISAETISHIEVGRRRPSLPTLVEISRVLKIDLSCVFAPQDNDATGLSSHARLEDQLLQSAAELDEKQLKILIDIADVLGRADLQ